MNCVYEAFEHCASSFPQATAITCGETESLTYEELNRKANQIARVLHRSGLKPGDYIAVQIERRPFLIAVLIGVLKAGGAFLPLDGPLPQKRIEHLLADAQPRLILADEYLGTDRHPGFTHVSSEMLEDMSQQENDTNINLLRKGDDPAYLIYTSGSTGRPKGVMISHGALWSVIGAMQSLLQLCHTDRWLALTTISFDIAILEWSLPLSVGAQVILANRKEANDGSRLFSLALRSMATVMQATPAMWQLFISGRPIPQYLRVALCGGEAMPVELANRFAENDACTCWNLYGPTEATIWSIAHQIGRFRYSASPPIGRPLTNTSAYVLDDAGQVAQKGELYLGGLGIAQGYLNDLTLTANKFGPDPFIPKSAGRLYRTGDRVFWNSDGELEFLGRIDDQIKSHGYRIEPGEIETAIRQLPGVSNAAVVSRQDDTGDNQLIAYLVAKSNMPLLASTLRRLLQAQLPGYMIPSVFVELPDLPLTSSGKTDRLALKALARRNTLPANTPELYVPPSTPLEALVAQIWAEAFGVPHMGTTNDFFELGGNSLLATLILLKIEHVTHQQLFLSHIFDNPTVQLLAQHLGDGGKHRTL